MECLPHFRARRWISHERDALLTASDTGRLSLEDRLRLGTIIAKSEEPLDYAQATFLVEVVAQTRRGRVLEGWKSAQERLDHFCQSRPDYQSALLSLLNILAPQNVVADVSETDLSDSVSSF